MGNHTPGKSHDSGKQEGGQDKGSSGGKATLRSRDGWAVGRPGQPDNYTER